MVVGVHLDLGPKKRMQSMDDPTDAEMAKEGRGLMMCIVFRVSQQRTNSGSTINLSFFYVVSKKNVYCASYCVVSVNGEKPEV